MTKKESLRLKKMMLNFRKDYNKIAKIKICRRCDQSFLGHAGTHEPVCEYCEAEIPLKKIKQLAAYHSFLRKLWLLLGKIYTKLTGA